MNFPGATAARSLSLLGYGTAIVCGGLIFNVISSFFRPTPAYNGWAAEPIFLVAGLLVLWLFVKGNRIVTTRCSLQAGLMAMLLLLGAVSTLLAEDPVAAWNRLKLYYACALLGMGLSLACRSNVRPVIVPFFLAIGVIDGWFLVELMASIYAWEGRRFLPQGFVMNYFSNIRHFGYLGFLAACAGMGVSLLGEHRYLRWTGYLLSVLALYGVIQFGSRGAFLAWIIFVTLLFAVVPTKRSFALACVAAVSLASLAVLYAEINHLLPDTSQLSVFARHEIGEDQLGTMRARIGIWQDSWREIVKRPVLGHGPDAYVLSGCCLKGSVQPHNSVVQFLFEFGMLGTCVALSWLVAFLWRPLRFLLIGIGRGQPDVARGVLVFLPVSLLVFSLVDGLLYHVVPLLTFSILMGLLGAAAYSPLTVAAGAASGTPASIALDTTPGDGQSASCIASLARHP